MQAVILAGGYGTRISEESYLRPKPMIEIGGKPILWHIMKIYSSYSINEFIICLGYKGYCIKEYFANYFLHESDVTFDFTKEGAYKVHHHSAEPWKVTLVDTGLETLTGGRVKRIQPYIKGNKFLLTYGDGVGDVNIKQLIKHHASRNELVTVTATKPRGRFGLLNIGRANEVISFQEKVVEENSGWVNAGFFVMDIGVFDYIEGDQTILEEEPLEKLTNENELSAFKHHGFWQPMDTVRDKKLLEELWETGKAPWAVWDNAKKVI